DRDHLPAAVGAAGGANLVAEGRFVAGGAARNVGRGELPVRPTLQLLLPGGALLRDSHGKLLQIVRLGRQNGPRAGKAPITTCAAPCPVGQSSGRRMDFSAAQRGS